MSTNSTTKSIVQYLNMKDYFVWRANNVGVYDPKQKIYRKNPAALKGVADILGIRWDGKFIAIEVKTGKDKLSEHQKHFLDQIEKHNGEWYVVKTFDDFLKQFEAK